MRCFGNTCTLRSPVLLQHALYRTCIVYNWPGSFNAENTNYQTAVVFTKVNVCALLGEAGFEKYNVVVVTK